MKKVVVKVKKKMKKEIKKAIKVIKRYTKNEEKVLKVEAKKPAAPKKDKVNL